MSDPHRNLLLVSNSTCHGHGYLEHCEAEIREILGARQRVLFFPFALADHTGYAAKAAERFLEMGFFLPSIHDAADPLAAIESTEAFFIGGGNTFRLLKSLYDRGLVEAIRRRVAAGVPYIGSSAGSNVATISIRTTNDMPIVYPPTFDALGLVPFNLNPHYLDPDPTSKHMGETREERIRQFHEENAPPVVGLREGAMLRVRGNRMTLQGETGARLFERGREPREFVAGADLSWLLGHPPS